MHKRLACAALAVILLCLIFAQPTLAKPVFTPGEGEILLLTAQGASDPGDPIVIDSTVRAITKCQNTNLYYEVYSPSMTLVDTHKTKPPALQPGESFDDNWSTYNTPETGDYTITLCWSTGNSPNCNIDYAETTVWSVPTLGLGLTFAAVGLLGVWLYRRRDDFQEVAI